MVKYVYHNCFIPAQRLYGLVPVYIIRRLFRKFFKAEKMCPPVNTAVDEIHSSVLRRQPEKTILKFKCA